MEARGWLARVFAAYDDGGSCPTPYPAADWYSTDVYLSSTLRRVEIGNANTVDASTIREVQPFLSWSPGEISARVNLGPLTSGPAWLYVLGDDGQPIHGGYPVTVP